MATQIQKLIQENTKNSEKMGWKDDFQWIKKDLIGNHPPPAGTEAKGEGQTSSEEPSTHQILIPGYNGKDITLNSTATQILDSAGNMSPAELNYANDRLSGKFEAPAPPKVGSNKSFTPLEETFQKGGSHQYSPPASNEEIRIFNYALVLAGGMAASAPLVGAIGVSGATTSLTQVSLRAGAFLTTHPNAEKWFNRGMELGKGFLFPAHEAPRNQAEGYGFISREIFDRIK